MLAKHKNWTREETIVAFNLYCKVPFREITRRNAEVIKLAIIIGRTPSAISMKIGNLARLDPELKRRGISGLVNGSRLDEEIWEEFNKNWNKLAYESEEILANLQGISLEKAVATDPIIFPDGSDRQTLVKVRVNQSFFRSAVQAAYDNRCCITGLTIDSLLVASHIIPWSKDTEIRTDPRNGLLLNSLHDKAFDTGLITVTPDYKIRISRHIHELAQEEIIKMWFTNYDGKYITLPERFLPSKKSLKWHNDNVFRGL
jgi:putative restriction endonuclease